MRVSVLMTVYNEKLEWIEESLNSLLNQTYKDIEIIIVIDNPENKKIVELVNNYAQINSCIKYIRNEFNIGLALSLNRAFKLSTGSLIARMDADDICIPTRFENQVTFLNENEQYDLITASCNYINEDSEIIGTRKNKNIRSYHQLKKSLEIQNFLIHPSWMMRRSLFEKLNGYRNFECSQDYDFILRTITEGLKIYNSHDVLVNYRVRESSISVSKGYKQHVIAKYILECYFTRKMTGEDDFTLEHLNLYLSEKMKRDTENSFVYSKKLINEFKNSRNIINKVFMFPKLMINQFSREQIINSIKLLKIEKVGGIN